MFLPPMRKPKGFGLAEILVSIGLFSTAFLYMLGTLTSANHAIKQSGDNLLAQDLAERVMEDYKGRTYEATVSSASNGTWNATYSNNGVPVTLAFQYQVDVSEVNLAPPFNTKSLKNIQVTVAWRTRYMEKTTSSVNRVRSVVLQTSVGAQ